ncbi:BACON domain-containing protein [Millionella massiliensis]|uniref:BACON domain-containing protein n=1 Tax=Millionella massiliensis TaxID=1871023 RepID=UPI0024B7846F|nr:BACON domain-containing carbohydrate-binding protein [Millionella massiliensis]
MNARLFFIALASLFAFSHCSKDSGLTPPPGKEAEITLDVADLTLPDGNAQSTLAFYSSADWTIDLSDTKGVEEWLSVEPRSGAAGQASVTVTAQPNENYDDRSAVITIRSGSASKSLPVYQKKKNALILSKEKYELSDEETDIDVEVKSNIDFEVKILDSWITQIQTKALTTHQLRFHIAANELPDNREGRIVIKSKSSDLADTVHVYQSRQNSLVLNQREYAVSEEGETIEVVLKSNVDFTVQMPDVDWIEEVQTKSLQTYKYQYRILPNETYDGREAQIVFKDNDSNLADTVFVYQTTKDALLLTKDRYEMGIQGGTIDVEVKSNVDFEVKILDDWITQWQTKGLETYYLWFDVQPNANNKRTGKIVFLDKNSSLTDTVYVVQLGTEEIQQDREALIALYKATNGDNWIHNDNWCTDKPLNEWYGVTTDQEGRVISLGLSNNNLSGDFPDNIGLLANLRELYLDFNNFAEIPANIGKLQCLEILTMYSNDSPGSLLGGNIPSSLGNLSNLKRLSLGGDFGPMPEELGNLTRLEMLDIQGPWYNRSVSESIPNWIQDLKNLKDLRLILMNLTGTIPDWIYDLTKLEELHLSDNQLTGSLSEKIGNLKELTYLTLNSNALTGSIPASITLLKKLQCCYIDRNNLTGTLPKGFGELTNLLVLSAYGNRLSGEIPEDFEENPNFGRWGVDGSVLPQQSGYVLSLSSHYASSDYSADGEVMTLQKATTGKGVDIVLLGDGFVDRDMGVGGKYEQAMQEACGYLFALEPMKSYREYFNVYAVKAVSKNERFGTGYETAFNAVFGTDGRYVYGDDNKCFEYASKAPIHSVDELVVAVVLNSNAYGGTAFWHGTDAAVCYVSMTRPVDGYYEKTFEATFIHEVVGHGFGKLADEYVEINENFPAEAVAQENELYELYGWNANVSYSSDPEQVRWKHMLDDPRYSSYTGMIEGGNSYARGVWRPEDISMMNVQQPYFNAPSREAIVKRIKRLAGESYSFEEFAAKDKYEPVTHTKSAAALDEVPRLPSPVIVRK